jgi:SNF2 family DNA or RNA helicase
LQEKAALGQEVAETLYRSAAADPTADQDAAAGPVRHRLRTPLLPHQHNGVRWMLDREARGQPSGGVLADEMGLGKSVQVRLREQTTV